MLLKITNGDNPDLWLSSKYLCEFVEKFINAEGKILNVREKFSAL